MSIDRIIAPAAPRMDTGPVARDATSKVDGEGSDTAADPLSFSAVLTSMEDIVAESRRQAEAADLPVQPSSPLPAIPDAEPVGASDAAGLLAQMLGGAAVAAGAARPERVGEAAGADALVGVGAELGMPTASRADKTDALSLVSPAGARAPAQVHTLAPVSAAALQPEGQSGLEEPGAALLRRVHAQDAHRASAATGMEAGSDLRSSAVADLSEGKDAASGRGDWRTAVMAQADRLTAATPTGAEVSAAAFRSLPALRGAERTNARSVFMPLDSLAPGGASAANFSGPSVTGTLAPATADAPMAAGASSEIAHKVHYWVTRGVQNAELQVDGPGGTAVDVSITLQGKEALVEFRTDLPDARRALQDALPQLRDMLRSEGLQLASGFVGTSAQQRDGDAPREAPSRGEGRVGTVVATGTVPAEHPRRTGAASAHALDVFV